MCVQFAWCCGSKQCVLDLIEQVCCAIIYKKQPQQPLRVVREYRHTAVVEHVMWSVTVEATLEA